VAKSFGGRVEAGHSLGEKVSACVPLSGGVGSVCVGKRPIHPKCGNVPSGALQLSCNLSDPGNSLLRGETHLRAFLEAHEADASIASTPRTHRLSGKKADPENTLFWAFVAGLAWCPFLFGGDVLLAWGINAVLFPGLVAIYEISLLIRGKRHPVAIWQIKAPVALFAVVVLWILIQNTTWTPGWWHHPIWQMAADALGKPLDGSISVNRELTSLALLRLITAASAFWIALQLCRDASRASLLLWSIAAITCAYAAYGLVAFALKPANVPPFENLQGVVTSTFSNPNCFAAYAGIGLVAFCGLILRLYRNEFANVGGSLRFRIASFIEVTGQKGIALLGGAFVILVALLLSGSRGGIASTALGLIVLAAVTFRLRKHQFAEQRVAILVIGALLVAASFVFFGDAVAGKISQAGLRDQTRMAVYTIIIRSIFDTPVLGYGYGTFADVFPMFRDQSISTWGKWQMAHNTYLEVLQGLGLVFGSMLLACVCLLVLRCINGAATRQMNETLPCVAASVAFLLGMHALVDFSLQMQATTVTFMALLGAGVAQSESSRVLLGD
jgi:O-antigen ligase